MPLRAGAPASHGTLRPGIGGKRYPVPRPKENQACTAWLSLERRRRLQRPVSRPMMKPSARAAATACSGLSCTRDLE